MKTKKLIKQLIVRVESIKKNLGLRHELSKGITVTVEYNKPKTYITTDNHPLLKEGIVVTLEENGYDMRVKILGSYFVISTYENSNLSISNNWIKEQKS